MHSLIHTDIATLDRQVRAHGGLLLTDNRMVHILWPERVPNFLINACFCFEKPLCVFLAAQALRNA